MTLESDIVSNPADRSRPLSRLALLALILALLLALLCALAGFGAKWSIWSPSTGLSVVRAILWVAIPIAILAAVTLFAARPGGPRRGFVAAFLALVLALLVLGASLQLRRAEALLPPIHDITTDVRDPPPFVALAPVRTDDGGALEYQGEAMARIQEVAYPEVQPVLLDLAHYDAYLLALEVAKEMGWTVVAAEEREGRIEATARTPWFGFREDIVIRLTAVGSRTVVDVRSSSRDRGADLGSNAHRIRTYLDGLTD